MLMLATKLIRAHQDQSATTENYLPASLFLPVSTLQVITSTRTFLEWTLTCRPAKPEPTAAWPPSKTGHPATVGNTFTCCSYTVWLCFTSASNTCSIYSSSSVTTPSASMTLAATNYCSSYSVKRPGSCGDGCCLFTCGMRRMVECCCWTCWSNSPPDTYLNMNFQMSHISPECLFTDGLTVSAISREWAQSQLATTLDYAHGSPLVRFLVGCLEFSVYSPFVSVRQSVSLSRVGTHCEADCGEAWGAL